MNDNDNNNPGPSRREFLWTLGAGAPGVTLLNAAAQVAVPPTPPSEATGFKEGGDPAYHHLTFDAVTRDHHEVTYEEVADAYGGPMSRGPLVSVKAHPELVWSRPDMGIGMVANPLAFGIGTSPQMVRWQSVERSLLHGYLPIVVSRYKDGDLRFEQMLYATLLDGGDVKTGREKQVAMIRMSAFNASPTEPQQAVWWAFAPAAVATTDPPPYFWSYKLFDVTGALPTVTDQPAREPDGVWRDGQALLGAYEPGPGVAPVAYEKAVRFEMDLLPGQKKNVCLKLSTNKRGLTTEELVRLRRLDFTTERDRRVLDLDAVLNRGAKIRVPEDAVNNIFRAQILYNQTQMVQAADRDYYMPVQASAGVWPWEHMHQLSALDGFGYHDDVRKSLAYFLKLQGRRPPNAQVKSYAGFFPSSGTFEESGWEDDTDSTIYGVIAHRPESKAGTFPNWLCNTGCVLRLHAAHYFYTRDRQWLMSVAPALIKGCDWIIESRQSTMQRDAQGEKVLQYGLMPAGQPYDTPVGKGDEFFYCWTDGYTYFGFEHIAEALADAGHADGPRLLREAASYRHDILEAMRRVRNTDPNLPVYPEKIHGPEGWGSFGSGALSLVHVGLVGSSDPAFEAMEHYMKEHFNLNVLGLTARCHQDDKGNRGSYYVTLTEDVWHAAWAERGEVEKALLCFYSNLAYGVDKETRGAIERFMLHDRRYAPFFMDASGGMRICNMIRRTLMLEQGRELRLLPATPRRWLEAGKKIEVEDVRTYFGSVSLRVDSQVQRQRIVAELEMKVTSPERLKKVSLRVPHPAREQMKKVTLDGRPWSEFQAETETIQFAPTPRQRQVVVEY